MSHETLEKILEKCNELKTEEFNFDYDLKLYNPVFYVYWNSIDLCALEFSRSNSIRFIIRDDLPIALHDIQGDYIDYNVIYEGLEQVKNAMESLKILFIKPEK